MSRLIPAKPATMIAMAALLCALGCVDTGHGQDAEKATTDWKVIGGTPGTRTTPH